MNNEKPAKKRPIKKKKTTQRIQKFEWQGPEFIYTPKSPKWYLYLAVVLIVLIIFFRFVSKDIVTPILIITLGLIFAYYSNKKPNQIAFKIDEQGITAGDKSYFYSDLKSYSETEVEDYFCINFLPNKRFSILVPVYFEKKDLSKIHGILENKLPLNNRKEDPIERFVRYIGF
jgi:hypothetical protein